MQKDRIPDLISEIKDEMKLLENLIAEIKETAKEIPQAKKKKRVYEESLALKLHNFYTGCERIFQKIADDINGSVPRSFDWHKRLLKTMALDIEHIRPPVISRETEKLLLEYLAFRHLVRNIYGFEIDSERLQSLLEKSNTTFRRFKQEVNAFLGFLRKIVR